MTQRQSIYLDLVRALAALAVILDHARELFDLPWLPRWGHQAVVVFFVLSGYVITHVADTRETTGRAFLVARFARLWSVLVPAMALTVVCDLIGRTYGVFPGGYATVHGDWPLIRIGASLAFVAESWVSIQPWSNDVVWSLCVEFWYYMIFAAWTFSPPGRRRGITVAACCLLSGFKALLLLPVWMFGVALARGARLRRLDLPAAAILFMASSAACVAVLASHRIYDAAIAETTRVIGAALSRQLAVARVFWLDWLFGLAVAANLLGARVLVNRLPMERAAGPIRWCAGVSFAGYLFHMPLLHLCAAFLPPSQGIAALGLTLAVIAVLGPPAERSKRWWRRQIGRVAAATDSGQAAART